MNAPANKPGQGGAADVGGQDGSMEDILASIRRILAEDQAAPPPPPMGDAQATPADDVLDLTEQMLAPEAKPDMKPDPKAAPAQAGKATSAADAGMSSADIDALFAASQPEAAAKPPDQLNAADIDAMFDAPPAQVPPPSEPAKPAPGAAAPRPDPEGGLIGGTVAAAAAASIAALRAATRGPVDEARPAMPDMLLGNGAVTLEQIVRDELRTLLKAWLDANLPPLVERLVKAELERVTRG